MVAARFDARSSFVRVDALVYVQVDINSGMLIGSDMTFDVNIFCMVPNGSV